MREIDVMHQGTPRAICCFAIDDVIVDPGPESSHRTLLDGLDGFVPRAILLTHIHFDHAGATGALCRLWPDAEVWVHERGARHMADPSRLVASAQRIYGDRFDTLWGEVVPVPEERMRVLSGGERLDGFRVEYTPGHASHHVAYLHEGTGTAFTGDVAGVRIGDGPILPPTPPPDIDVELWLASMDIVEAWRPERIAVTHFGAHDPAGHLDTLRSSLRLWADKARELGKEAFEDWVREEMRGDDSYDSYLEAMPPETLYAGLERYWAKRISSDPV
jgi:glyoxylase-like metal-dependent hydrolase (beta-lactamase superfamily II)